MALVPVQSTWAKLYKWVDADGNVTYSERKPPEVKAEEVKLRGTGISNEQAEENLEQLREKADTQQQDREFEATATAEIKEREERLKKNCEIARQNMRVLTNSSRIQATGEDGTRSFLNEEQIKARMDQTAKQVEQYCN